MGAAIRRPVLVLGRAEANAGMLHVGQEGAEWAFPGGCSLIARPGTALRIWGSTQPVYFGAKKARAYTVTLDSGDVRVKVPDGGPTAIVISAPHQAVALIGSGEANVHAGDAVAVAKAGGITLVRLGSESYRPLEPGVVALLGKDGEHLQPAVAAPNDLHGATVLVSYGDPVRTNAFSWEPTPGAVSYRAEVRRLGSGELVARAETPKPRLEPLGDLTPGSYELRLDSVDSTGMESTAPLVRELHVMQIVVPPGGHVDASGAVRVPKGKTVQLSHMEGVEMTYGNGTHYVPAPSALEFFQAERRLVHFRARGETDILSVWFLPREARALVEFGSTAPTWPGEPLQIRVRLTDAGGDDAAKWLEPSPKVMVGIEAVKVEFTREGEWLCGALPARPGAGPWVVRVEVHDQHGIEIGRDFVEVAGARPENSATRGKPHSAQASAVVDRKGS